MCDVGTEGTLFDGYKDTKLFKINFASLATLGTIEFRQHDNTTLRYEIISWMNLLLRFCSAAINPRSPNPFELAKGTRSESLDILFRTVFQPLVFGTL